MSEIDQDNPEVDVESAVDPNVASGDDAAEANTEAEQLFLEVDARTKFKTPEDAKKSFHEAGQRIAQLTPYEKAVRRYGIASAEQLPTLLDELIAFREAKEAAEKAPKAEPKAEPQNLSKEDKEIREYLKKVAPELGFVSKDEIAALKAELTELKSGVSGQSEARVQSLIEEGQSTVASYLADAKIDDPNGKKALVIETLVRAAIEGDRTGDLERRFFQGGREMKALLKELSDQAIESLGWTPSVDTTKPNAAAAHALNKGKQIVVNKTLPKADAASKGPGAKPKQSTRVDHIRDLGDKAWEEFQAALK